MHYETGA